MKLLVHKLKFILSVMMAVGIVASCASHPDEEQVRALEETKEAALSAEKTLADKKRERSDLESKIATKKAELEKVKAEKAKVLQKLEAKKAAEGN
jgi:septal ring factor EnvC (AmiA/AmiB activator)